MLLDEYRSLANGTKVLLFSLAAIISFCGVFGASYVAGEGWPVLDLYSEILLSFLLAPLIAIFFLFIDALTTRLVAKSAPEHADRSAHRIRLERLIPQWNIRSVLLFASIMLVLWLPWYLANFPGGTYWDTYYQIYQIYPENHPIAIIPWEERYHQTLTDAWLVDHHPIFTTLVYGAFGWVSDQLTGNWMIGVAVFCAIQGILHCIAFTASVAYLRLRDCPPIICFIGFAFFALMPFIPTWSMCMVKDSFFGLALIPYFMMLFEALRTDGKCLRQPRITILFVLCALLLCLTKKTGIFLVIFTALVAIIVLRKNRAAILTFGAQAVLSFLLLVVIFPLMLFPALDIESGGKQEILGPLFQQTARTVVDHEDEIPPEEQAAIDAVLPYDRLVEEYAFDFEDAVKYRFDLTATDEQIADYLKVYLDQGLAYPDSYFGAFMSLAGFYVAPTAYVNIRMVTVDTKMGSDHRYMLWNPEELDPLREGLDEAYKAVGSLPGVNIPLLLVTYVFWLPALLFFIAKSNRLRCGALFAPSVVLLAFCVIAPVYDARYAVPILDISPLLFGCIIALLTQKHHADGTSNVSPTGTPDHARQDV